MGSYRPLGPLLPPASSLESRTDGPLLTCRSLDLQPRYSRAVPKLFVAKRGHGIDAHRAECWEVAGENSGDK